LSKTQHSALSTQHSDCKRFLRHLISVVFLFVLSLNQAIASPAACTVGWWPKFFGTTPAIACEKARNYNAPQWSYEVGLSPDLGPTAFGCLLTRQNTDLIIIRYGGCYCPNHKENFFTNPSGTEAGCSDNAMQLTLTSAPNQTPPDPRPKGAEGKDGKSTHELIAKVMQGSTPKAGVAVTFAVEPIANSGGHDHHDASRPKGKVTANSPVTDANGEIKVTFQASQMAGTHVVAAVCSSCTNTSVTKNIDVKVPDLVPFLVLPLSGMQWNPNGVGDTPQHSQNHFLTMAATFRMLEVASKYKKIWPDAPQLTLNDASLEWGGKFDIDGTWEVNPKKHAEHRLGDNIDIRANTRPGNVPSDIRKVVFRWLRDESTEEDKIPVDLKIRSVNPLHEGAGLPNEHFHLRLGS
jgi:hypothetical protein